MPKALKSCPKCKKSPNLVTLFTSCSGDSLPNKSCHYFYIGQFSLTAQLLNSVNIQKRDTILWSWIQAIFTRYLPTCLKSTATVISYKVVFVGLWVINRHPWGRPCKDIATFELVLLTIYCSENKDQESRSSTYLVQEKLSL